MTAHEREFDHKCRRTARHVLGRSSGNAPENAEQTAQSSEVADKNAEEGENIPAKIASPTEVIATPPSPPLPPDGKSKLGCWSILWWCLKAMVRHWRITLFVLLVALIGYGAMVAYRTLTNSNNAVEKPIEQSPEEIVRLQAIGQWEFLSVEAEELVERHYSGLMSERDLVCIYRGTLRIGVDMRKTSLRLGGNARSQCDFTPPTTLFTRRRLPRRESYDSLL